MQNLGAVIREARLARSMRQIDLATLSGTSKSEIHRIETGRVSDLSLSRFLRICTALSVPPELILQHSAFPTLASASEETSTQ